MPSPLNSGLLCQIVPKNVFSFGPENSGVDLKSLNVLIGPNGSGKSNLIETINLMRSAPKEFRDATRLGGGVSEWIWKGQIGGKARIECTFKSPLRLKNSILHKIAFRAISQAFALDDERIEDSRTIYAGDPDVFYFYRYEGGYPSLNTVKNGKRQIAVDTIERDRSILAQRRDPEAYPELAWLAQYYETVRIYREWSFGHSAVFREPQKADMRHDALEEDFSNLGLFLNRLKTRFPVAKRAILAGLRDLYDGINDFDVLIEGGTVQVFFTEGDFTLPATRLSDGTLRYLCLLAILCDPEPPPLICIEEPELGLHPDILPKVADLLRNASLRSQLIVTTHSDILVNAMSDAPEAVVIWEKS